MPITLAKQASQKQGNSTHPTKNTNPCMCEQVTDNMSSYLTNEIIKTQSSTSCKRLLKLILSTFYKLKLSNCCRIYYFCYDLEQ